MADEIEIGLADVTKVVANIKQVAKALAGLADNGFGTLIKRTIDFNDEGDILGGTLVQLREDGSRVTSVLKQIAEATDEDAASFEVLVQSISKARKGLSELERDSARAVKAAARQVQKNADFETLNKQQVNAGNLIRSGLNTRPNGSAAENNALDNAIDRATNRIGKNGIDDNRILAVQSKLNAGATEFIGIEARIARQLQAVAAAADKVGNSYAKAGQAGLKAGNQQLANLVLQSDESGKTASKQIADSDKATAKAIANGNKQLAAFVKQGAEYQAAQEKRELTTSRNNDAGIAASRTQGLFATSLKFGNSEQINAYNVAVQRAIKLVASGRVTLEQFNTALNNVKSGKIRTETNPALVELQQKLLAVKNAFDVTGAAGEKAGSGIFLSFQNVIRIFEAQVIYAAFGKIQSAFTDATQDAAEYSKQIALIRTISQDSGLSTSQWADQVRNLSDQLGTPITDTAAAAYEALSNQVAKGADAFQFLATAGQLARTTGSKLEDSVDLISSALNSFELDTSQSERVAKSFFTTIDLGRVKIPELANSFGRSGVLAHQLGVELEELNSSISTLTRQGIKANEAYTLINNLFQKLIKPTEATEAFFKRIGVATAEEAFETYKLVGVLELLDKEFKSNSALQGELFPEIRGGRAARNLTGSGLQEVIKDLKENQNSGEKYSLAQQIVSDADGQKLDDEFNKIKNFFTHDVGGSFLKTVLHLGESIGGIASATEKAVGVVKTLVTIGLGLYAAFKLIALIGAFGQLGTAIAAVTAGTVGLGVAAAATTAVATAGISLLVAAGAAYLLSQTQFGESAVEQARKLTTAYQAEADEQTKIFTKATADQADAIKKSFDASKVSFLKFTSGIRVDLFKLTDSLKASSSSIRDSVKSQFDVMTALVRNNLSELENKLKKIATNLEHLRQVGKDSVTNFNASVFDRNLAYNGENVKNGFGDESIGLYTQRIDELKRQAKIKLFDGTDIQGGLKLLEEAAGLAAKLATTEKDGSLPFRLVGEQQLLEIEREKASLIQQTIVLEERRKKQIEEQAVAQRKLFEQLQEAQKNVASFDPIGKDGKLLPKFADPSAAVTDLDKKQKEVIGLLDKIEAGIDTKIHTAGEFAKQRADLLKLLAEQAKNNAEFVGAQTKLQQADQGSDALIRFDAERLKALGKINEASVENNRLQTEAIANARTQLALTLKQVGESFTPFLGLPGTIDPSQLKATDPRFKARATIKDAEGDLTPGHENIEKLKKDYERLKKELAGIKPPDRPDIFGAQTGTVTKTGKLATVQDSLDAIAGAIKKFEDTQANAKRLDDILKNIESQRDKLNAEAAKVDATFNVLGEDGVKAGSEIETSISKANAEMLKLQESTRQSIEQLGKLKSLNDDVQQNKLNRQAPGGVPGAPETDPSVGKFASGGFVDDFMRGKFASGTDIIPAMLGRGERVLTRAQNRDYEHFIPLISRSQGIFRTPRSSTTDNSATTNVGDINITVQGGSTSTGTLKQIASGLRRGLKQGTISLSP